MSDNRHTLQSGKLTLGLVPTDIEVRTDTALRIPFDQIPALGAGLSSLADTFAPATASITSPVLFTVTDSLGNPVPPSALQAFKDGSGLLGSFRDPVNGFGQARLHEVAQAPAMAFNPTSLAMAATLMVVTQKLDSIQQAQEEMFEYLRQRDKAELRGALQALADIARDYRFNWDNATFLQSSHAQVLEIRKQADSLATLQRSQIKDKLKGGPLEIRKAVEARLDKLIDHLAEYRLATYAHALASFLEPLLSDNVNAPYLRSIAERISAHGVAYRELYTECYEAIETSSRGALDAAVLSGISNAGKGLGSLLAQSPLGQLTPADDVLLDAGEAIERINESGTDAPLSKLRRMSSPEVLPLQQGVESLASLHEEPMTIAADSQALYLISDGQ